MNCRPMFDIYRQRLLNTVTPKFVATFVFFGTPFSFIERISFSEIEVKREAILFLFGCSEVNSTWIITSGLANQRTPKALFTCVIYTYILLTKREVKMARYWPSSLFAFLWTETKSRSIKT